MRLPKWTPCLPDVDDFDCGECEIGLESPCFLRTDKSAREFRSAEWRRRVGLSVPTDLDTFSVLAVAEYTARCQGLAVTPAAVVDIMELPEELGPDMVARLLRSSGKFAETSTGLFALASVPDVALPEVPLGSGLLLEDLIAHSRVLVASTFRQVCIDFRAATEVISHDEGEARPALERVVGTLWDEFGHRIGLTSLVRIAEGEVSQSDMDHPPSSVALASLRGLALLDQLGFAGVRVLAIRLREKLIRGNLKLVYAIARNYHAGSSLELTDLFQEGVMGLGRACDRYDPYRGFAFSTYATPWIRQAISRAIQDQDRLVRFPAYLAEEAGALERAAERADLDPWAADPRAIAEVLEATGRSSISMAHIAAIQAGSQPPVPIEHGVVGTIPDLDADPDDEASSRFLREAVLALVSELDDVGRLVITSRFGLDGSEPKTLEDVGQVLGLTRERIRQLQVKAINRLKPLARERQLRAYIRSS